MFRCPAEAGEFTSSYFSYGHFALNEVAAGRSLEPNAKYPPRQLSYMDVPSEVLIFADNARLAGLVFDAIVREYIAPRHGGGSSEIKSNAFLVYSGENINCGFLDGHAEGTTFTNLTKNNYLTRGFEAIIK